MKNVCKVILAGTLALSAFSVNAEYTAVEHDVPVIMDYVEERPATYGLEDAMCSAIYMAEYAETGSKWMKARINLLEWKRYTDQIHHASYAVQVEFYRKNLDTATVLLHTSRCWERILKIQDQKYTQ